MGPIEEAIIFLAVLIGGLLRAWVGWADSGEPFDERKFLATMINAFLAATGTHMAIVYELTGVPFSVAIVIGCIAIGAGIDVLIHDSVKVFSKRRG